MATTIITVVITTIAAVTKDVSTTVAFMIIAVDIKEEWMLMAAALTAVVAIRDVWILPDEFTTALDATWDELMPTVATMTTPADI